MTAPLAFAVSLLVKGTLVLVLGLAASRLLARQAAAVRHLAWVAALLVLVLLPLASPAVPVIPVNVPENALLPAPQPMAVMALPVDAGPAELASDAIVTADAPAPSHARPLMPWWLALWLAGTVLLLCRVAIGELRVRRLIAQATDGSTLVGTGTVAALAAAQHVQRVPRVLLSDAIDSPLMFGTRNPVIVLPCTATEWSAERRRIVLIHEIAHIARLDHLAQSIGDIACAIFWMHPVAWYAAARLRAEGEHAADDRVIAAGHPGVSYATHLVEIARHAAGAPPHHAAVAMARLNHLEQRVRLMLQADRCRGAVTRRHQVVAALFATVAVIPLAGIHARAVSSVQQPAVVRAAVSRVDSTTLIGTVAVRAGGTLRIDLRTGGNLVLHGSDAENVRVAVRDGATSVVSRDVDLHATANGATLVSSLPAARGTVVRQFDVWLPSQFDVLLTSTGGSVTVQDLNGEIRGRTDRGDVSIVRSSGMLSLSTGSGQVHLTDSHFDGSLTTSNGDVRMSQVTGDVRATSSVASPAWSADGLTPGRIVNGAFAADSVAVVQRAFSGGQLIRSDNSAGGSSAGGNGAYIFRSTGSADSAAAVQTLRQGGTVIYDVQGAPASDRVMVRGGNSAGGVSTGGNGTLLYRGGSADSAAAVQMLRQGGTVINGSQGGGGIIRATRSPGDNRVSGTITGGTGTYIQADTIHMDVGGGTARAGRLITNGSDASRDSAMSVRAAGGAGMVRGVLMRTDRSDGSGTSESVQPMIATARGTGDVAPTGSPRSARGGGVAVAGGSNQASGQAFATGRAGALVRAPMGENRTTSFRGAITDERGAPLADARVTIYGVGSGATYTAITNAAGQYTATFDDSATTYRVSVQHGSQVGVRVFNRGNGDAPATADFQIGVNGVEPMVRSQVFPLDSTLIRTDSASRPRAVGGVRKP